MEIASENIKNCSNVYALLSINESDRISDIDFLPSKRIYSIDGHLIMDNVSKLLEGEDVKRTLDNFFGFDYPAFTGFSANDDGGVINTCIGWTNYSRDFRYYAGDLNSKYWLSGDSGWCNGGASKSLYCLCY